MTAFIKDKFQKDGMYVSYEGNFVARFKHQKGAKASFITFLIKNFTVEEYFAAMNAGTAPLTILYSKGYLLPHIKKWLREAGLPLTQAGYQTLLQREAQHLKDTYHG